ncbi:unnamed protein product [Gongylonema pulchrum]|uniref:DExH-box ATP-dependent RNA helicase DExH7, chloroplastic n=1 Tax=Gongylonema pulchrum TaxID=637853 RepID=A0A183CWC7_9BILA|nr:unnamed protein product [Gongylonema pulchrum]
MMLSNEMFYTAVAKKGYAIGVAQPVATLLAFGYRKHLPWKEELDLRGPILIASKGKTATKDEIEHEIAICRQFLPARSAQREFPCDYPSGAIVGRALLTDCLSKEEYEKTYPKSECGDVKEPYVLIFDVFEALLVPIPHIPPSDGVYQVDKQLRATIKRMLDPVSFP